MMNCNCTFCPQRDISYFQSAEKLISSHYNCNICKQILVTHRQLRHFQKKLFYFLTTGPFGIRNNFSINEC